MRTSLTSSTAAVEQPFPGEDRMLVPSPKVATYDLKPEMSAAGIADTVVKAVEDGTFDVIIVNFANADMVGHSGKIEPTIKAVETVDACLGRIEPAVRAKGGAMLITADHGNAEMMIDPVTGGPHTAHTTNPVPFIVVSEDAKKFTLKPDGSLRDISPTILGMLGPSGTERDDGSGFESEARINLIESLDYRIIESLQNGSALRPMIQFLNDSMIQFLWPERPITRL